MHTVSDSGDEAALTADAGKAGVSSALLPRVAFVTLGCAKNEVDSDRMRALVRDAGFRILEGEGESVLSSADVVVVNTCAFLTAAVEEAIEVIFDILSLDAFVQGKAQLVVSGCMPARYKEDLPAELPEVAAFLDPCEEEGIVACLRRLTGFGDTSDEGEAARLSAVRSCDGRTEVPARTTGEPFAYVKIADGCDRFCAYCMIPYIRGRYRSRRAASICEEVALLVAGGAYEIVLIAQDTGIWGHDLADFEEGEPATLAALLDILATRFPHTWFRIMYTQPEAIDDSLLTVMAAHPNICNYLDIPLQHASETVLASMNRTGDAEGFLACIRHIRASVPGVTLRTTLMAGFPGERRADAAVSERFVREACFDYAGVFVYSQEEGSAAAARTDQVPLRTRKARAQRLRDLADHSGFARAQDLVGTTQEVLICGYEYDEQTGVRQRVGRTQGQAPDVDGIVYLPDGEACGIVTAKIYDACCYDLFAEILES